MPVRETEMPGENFVNEGPSNEYDREISAMKASSAKVAASIAVLSAEIADSSRAASAAANPQAMLPPPSLLGPSGSSSSKRLLKKGKTVLAFESCAVLFPVSLVLQNQKISESMPRQN